MDTFNPKHGKKYPVSEVTGELDADQVIKIHLSEPPIELEATVKDVNMAFGSVILARTVLLGDGIPENTLARLSVSSSKPHPGTASILLVNPDLSPRSS